MNPEDRTTDPAAQPDARVTPEQAHETWRRERHAAVTGPHGNLALVGFTPVGEEPERLDLIPVTVRREGDADELLVQADAADGVRLDGELVDGERRWARLRPDGTPLLAWGTRTADAFSLDGTSFEVRVYDSEAPRRAEFVEIECYPYDPAMVVPARLERDGQAHQVAWTYTRASDDGSVKQVPGRLVFELDGQEQALTGFLDGPVLVLTFADATTGRESHAPGRFLKVELPETGEVELDLNQAFIPPCGFSDHYSCPLPPPENRLTVPVRAGERHVSWRESPGA